MSGEIRLQYTLTATKSSLRMTPPSKSLAIDLSGTRLSGGVQDIGTTHEAIAFDSDLASIGWGELVNLDATNYVEIGRDVSGTFYGVIKLLPGESCPVRLATTALYARANTSAVKLQYQVLEA